MRRGATAVSAVESTDRAGTSQLPTARAWRQYVVALLIAALLLEAAAVAPGSTARGADAPATPASPPAAVEVESPPAEETPDPSELPELVELRTETSRTLDNGDGTLTAEIFAEPIHFRADPADSWQPIEVGFAPVSGEEFAAESDKAPIAVGLRRANDPAGYLSVDDGSHEIAFSLLGVLTASDTLVGRVGAVDPLLDGARATYPSVLPGIDLQVHAGADSAKTFVVLDAADAGSAFAFAVQAPGLDLKVVEDGSVALVDAGGVEVGRIPRPYAVDSSDGKERGGGAFSPAVSLEVTEFAGQPAVVVRVEAEWLASATFPVYVDPTYYPSSTTYGDAFVSAAFPTQNFADYVRPDSPYYHEHWLGTDPTNSSNVNYAYLRFDISGIGAATIDEAKLWVVPYHQYYDPPTSTTTWVDRVTGSWAENTLTWNNKPASVNVGSAALVEWQWGIFNVTSTVQAWSSGTSTNYGFKLHENGNGATYWKRLISYEQGSNQPHLNVTYHVPVASTTTPYNWKATRDVAWAFSDSEGHAQSHYQVQVSTVSDFSSIAHDSGAVSSAGTTYTIPTGVLSSNTWYYWRVRAKDGSSWSAYDSDSFLYDVTSPTGTVAINATAPSTNTSSVRVVLASTDTGTSSTYSNDGRSLTSLVGGCGSLICGSFASPNLGLSKAEGAVVVEAPTPTWHSLTVDPTASNRSTLAMDIKRDTTAPIYVGVVSDDNDGLRFELRSSGNNLTTLGYTATSTPGQWTNLSVNYAFNPDTWYRFVVASTGATGTYNLWWFERDQAMPAAPNQVVTGVYLPKPRLHVFAQGLAGPTPAHVWLDDLKVVQMPSAPYGSGTVGVRLSADGASWTNWMGYADAHEFTLPAGSGTRTVYAQFRDAAGNTTSSVSDTITVGFDNLGRQAQHRFESWDLGAGDEAAVNVANGNLVVGHPLVSLPYRGSNVLPLSLTYNSQESSNLGLGPGWQLDLQRRLIINGDNSITFVDADGARHTFTNPQTTGTVTTYTRPASVYATIVKDTSQGVEFTLTYRDQSRDRFDIAGSVGRLASIEDRHANAVALAYDGNGNLATATDPNSRQVTFTWDTAPTPDRLTSFLDWAWIDGSGIVQTTATGSRRSYRFFFDASGNLAGWSDPLNTVGSCPSGGSHLTCLTYTSGLVSAIAKTQTFTTFSAGTLGTATRTITTSIAYTGSRVSTLTDAEANATTFVPDGSDRLIVRRPTTTTTYNFQATADPYGRVAYTWRLLEPLTEIEQRTTWDATYPVEPASVTDNYGALENAPARTLTYTYQASSLALLAKLVEPLTATDDRWMEHSYNANNDVTQTIVSAEGSSTERTITRFCYDAGCNLTGSGLTLLKQIDNYVSGGVTDDDTNVALEYVSDSYGQVTRVIRHNRDTTGATLDDREDRFTFDANGHLTAEIVNYANGTVSNPGDDVTPNATTLARTDLTTSHSYDTAGNRVSSADPRRAIEVAKGTSLAADDFINRWTYDALNQQLTHKTPTTPGLASTQATASSAFDELGAVRTATDFGDLASATEFDRAGRALRTFQDPSGASATVTSITTNDADGRPMTAKDERQVDDAGLGLTAYVYDALGRQVSTISADETGSEAQDDAAYDGLGRAISREGDVGGDSSLLTTFAYDLGGRQIETDDGFACTTEGFDYRDLPTATTSGLAGGTCASAADRREVTHTRDGLGRLIRSEVTDGADDGDRTLDEVFDAVGNRRSVSVRTDGVATTSTFTINLLDQPTVDTRADGSTAKTTYDPAGNPVDRCYWAPGSTVSACLDAGSYPWTNPPTQVTTSAYDARGGRISLTDPTAGSVTTYDPDHNYAVEAVYRATGSGREHQALHAYDDRHRLTDIEFQTCTANASHTCTDTPVANGADTYAYDDNHNRTQVIEINGSVTSDRRYCYDARNQLIFRNTGAACSSGANDESWTYDGAGNRLTAASGSTTNFAYDAAGLLCDAETGAAASCSGGNISHDTAGRIGSWNGWTFGYDAEARLVTACKSPTCASGSDKLEFTYDGEGHRTKIVATAANSTVTASEFRYQGDAVVEERVNGTVVRRFVTNESGAISKLIVPAGLTDAGTYLVSWNGHGDALNLLRVNGDGTTTLANTFTYDTWGTPTTATHNSIGDLGFRYLYVGQFDVQWDNTFGLGLHYMHARHYAPALGRFVQPDPVRYEAMPFVYAGNQPVSAIDPSGEGFFALFLVPVVIAVARTVLTSAAVRWGVPFVGAAWSRWSTWQTQLQQLGHICQRHCWNSTAGVSRFYPWVSWANLIWNSSSARLVGMSGYWSNGGFVGTSITLVRHFSYNVGIDKATGAATNVVTYIYRNGILWTMHPGYP